MQIVLLGIIWSREHYKYSKSTMEVKGLDVGGLFNFIRHQPNDTSHTKEKKLWKSRFQHGMCPHCGQKVMRIKIKRLRRVYIPLNIPAHVDNGVCIHPRCDPPLKKSPQEDYEVEVSDDATVDTRLDSIQEYRADMEKFYNDLHAAHEETRDTAAMMLEETVMQLNRSMSELSAREQAKLHSFKEDLSAEIDTAQGALLALNRRMDHMEEVMHSLKAQVSDLRNDSERKSASLRAEVDALRVQLDGALRNRKDSSSKSASTTNPSLFMTPTPEPREILPGFPKRRRFRCQQTLSNATGVICSAIIHDGESLVYGSNDNLLRVAHRSADGRYNEKHVYALSAHSDWINCCAVAYEHRSPIVVSGSNDKSIVVWKKMRDGHFKQAQRLWDHSSSVFCCALTHDGRLMISGDKDSSVIVWKLKSDGKFEAVQRLKEHTNSVEDCVLIGNGSMIVTASSDETLKLWKRQSASQSYTCVQTLKKHSGAVMCCATEDGRVLVSGSHDDTLIVWKRQRDGLFEHYQTLKGHRDWINCCAVVHGGQTLLSGSDDHTLKIWQRQSDGRYECVQLLNRHENFVSCCAVIDGFQTLVTGGNDNTVKIWKLEDR